MIHIPTYEVHLLEEAKSRPILFIAFPSDENGEREAKSKFIKEKCPNCELVQWDDISLHDGVAMCGDVKLDDYYAVLVGVIGENDRIASTVIDYLCDNDVKMLVYGGIVDLNNKALQTVRMKLASVTQIPTIVGDPTTMDVKELIDELKLPIVSKIINGSKGKGVEKHDDEASLKKWMAKSEGTHIMQSFVPNDGDYRICVVDEKVVYSIQRKSSKGSEFRNNVSLGGTAKEVKLPKEALDLAVAAAACMGQGYPAIFGIDLIQHKKTKEWYVMEINSAPQLEIDDLIDSMAIEHIVDWLRK